MHLVHVWHWFSPQLLPIRFCRHLRLGSLGWSPPEELLSSFSIGLGLVPVHPFVKQIHFLQWYLRTFHWAPLCLQFTVSPCFRQSRASCAGPRSRRVCPSQPLRLGIAVQFKWTKRMLELLPVFSNSARAALQDIALEWTAVLGGRLWGWDCRYSMQPILHHSRRLGSIRRMGWPFGAMTIVWMNFTAGYPNGR